MPIASWQNHILTDSNAHWANAAVRSKVADVAASTAMNTGSVIALQRAIALSDTRGDDTTRTYSDADAELLYRAARKYRATVLNNASVCDWSKGPGLYGMVCQVADEMETELRERVNGKVSTASDMDAKLERDPDLRRSLIKAALDGEPGRGDKVWIDGAAKIGDDRFEVCVKRVFQYDSSRRAHSHRVICDGDGKVI